MYIEALGQQIAVCSFDGASRLTGLDKNYWNVISIHGPQERKAELRLAKTIHYCCFNDVEDEDSALYRSPRAADIAGIFGFIRSLGTGPPPAPLMIHCQQGISRSAAVALAWIYGHLPPTDDRPVRAIDLILELRPQAKPNRLVLALGLAQFMELSEAQRLADWIVSEPRLMRNRFGASIGEGGFQ
jgi:predicted protein tyrosine phosphatase